MSFHGYEQRYSVSIHWTKINHSGDCLVSHGTRSQPIAFVLAALLALCGAHGRLKSIVVSAIALMIADTK